MLEISQQLAEIEANAKNVLCPELLYAMNQKYRELTEKNHISTNFIEAAYNELFTFRTPKAIIDLIKKEQMKTEILEAIRKTNFEFENTDDYSRYSFAQCKKTIESENYNIEVEIEEKREKQGNDFEHTLSVLSFKVFDQKCKEIETEISDLEIINIVQ